MRAHLGGGNTNFPSKLLLIGDAKISHFENKIEIDYDLGEKLPALKILSQRFTLIQIKQKTKTTRACLRGQYQRLEIVVLTKLMTILSKLQGENYIKLDYR